MKIENKVACCKDEEANPEYTVHLFQARGAGESSVTLAEGTL